MTRQEAITKLKRVEESVKSVRESMQEGHVDPESLCHASCLLDNVYEASIEGEANPR